LTDKTIGSTRHFVSLDKCDCGAYVYLRARVRKKRIVIQLYHTKKMGRKVVSQQTRTLAVIPKEDLDIHNKDYDGLWNSKEMVKKVREIVGFGNRAV
jgi:hypothetical protein